MTVAYITENTCTRQIKFELEDRKLNNVQFIGGCDGNLKALSKLMENKDVDDIKDMFTGLTCGRRPTSCMDQLVKAIDQALA